MYFLLVPPIAVAITLLVIAAHRFLVDRPAKDDIDAHRRCLEALDPRAPARKAAQQAAAEAPAARAQVRRHA